MAKFSLSAFLKACSADAKAAEQGVLSAVPAIAKDIDKIVSAANPFIRIFDPPVADGVAAADALVDEAAAAITAGTKKNEDGSLTFTVTPTTVAGIEGAVKDGESWLSKIGIK